MNQYLIIDFDSTINKLEALDELANIVDARNGTTETSEKIRTITELGMLGHISFSESLSKRMELLKFNRTELQQLIDLLKANLSQSFLKNVSKFEEIAPRVIVISGGFKDFIVPVLADFKLLPENIYANDFIFDSKGNCAGINEGNLLAQDQGKVNTVNSLGLYGEIIVVGDGFTDYQIKELGAAHKFIAFIENVERPSVTEKADFIVKDFDELFKYLGQP